MDSATRGCKRNIEMTPLCKIEVTHPRVLGSREVRHGVCRFSSDNFFRHHNAVLGRALMPTIGENVDAAGDLNELRHPPNSGEQRIVPFLEEYPWPLQQSLRTASGFFRARILSMFADVKALTLGFSRR